MPSPQSLLALALVLCAGTVAAAPKDELHQAYSRFLAAKSFRASVTDVKKGQQLSTLEFVAPDRYRIQNGQGQMEQILIGEDAYTLIDGRRIKLPMPIQVGRIVGQYRNPDALDQLAQDIEVTGLGSETVDGIATQVYSYTVTEPSRAEVKVWVDSGTGLPLQLESSGSFMRLKSVTRIRYYDYNDGMIRVHAPTE